jgi:hypothetical protein
VLEQMLPVPGSRLVTFSSIAHRIQARINFDDLQSERSYNQVGAYGQSKLANLMFTCELQRRPSGTGTTIAVAAHPGFTATELARNSPTIVALFYVRVMSQKVAMGATTGDTSSLAEKGRRYGACNGLGDTGWRRLWPARRSGSRPGHRRRRDAASADDGGAARSRGCGGISDEARGRERPDGRGRPDQSAGRHHHGDGHCPRGRRWEECQQGPDF